MSHFMRSWAHSLFYAYCLLNSARLISFLAIGEQSIGRAKVSLRACLLCPLSIFEIWKGFTIFGPSISFEAFRHLKELFLCEESPNVCKEPLRVGLGDKPSLELACLRYCGDSLKTIRASMDITRLKEVSIHTDSPSDAWKTIKDSASSLQT